MVDTYRPTYLFTMAPILHILMAAPPSLIEREHGLRAMFVLAAGAHADEIEQRFGTPVVDCYGMSECPCGTYTRLDEPRRPGSAGRAFPHVELRILRADGSFAEPDEPGEVVFRHGRIFDGYLDDPKETARAVRDGWFHTGDLGRLDGDGFFYFIDRQKDVIRRGGENISSQEVEAALRAHPAVRDVAAVACADPVLGERVVAFVIPTGDDAPTLEQLRAWGATTLAPYKLPEQLVVASEFPRTASGKVQKFALRESLSAMPEAEGRT
jgi:acyl-CoA synthetase (AMP-forming)/AMP-acid ligase II